MPRALGDVLCCRLTTIWVGGWLAPCARPSRCSATTTGATNPHGSCCALHPAWLSSCCASHPAWSCAGTRRTCTSTTTPPSGAPGGTTASGEPLADAGWGQEVDWTGPGGLGAWVGGGGPAELLPWDSGAAACFGGLLARPREPGSPAGSTRQPSSQAAALPPTLLTQGLRLLPLHGQAVVLRGCCGARGGDGCGGAAGGQYGEEGGRGGLLLHACCGGLPGTPF